ncbi:hypothetical protein [Clostridium saccharobutylicum]|uniref:Uncharacterized protein n=1 Tax=Clostridium saccharobutylicum TaxID=169679 RepID=A0A1S8NE17_CLOSA|nr:hypothetical protein [Clostridium saccharobutylicum]OOM14643.1 hypothetical protein CLOSAC_15230 [Clostridium saccharobutylicum]
MNTLKEDKMYIFEMIDERELDYGNSKDSKTSALSTVNYLGNGKQIIEIRDKIADYNSCKFSNKNLYNQYYVDYVDKLVEGADTSAEFSLGSTYKDRVIYDCEMLNETELTHMKNKWICDLMHNFGNSNYDNVYFKSLDYKYKYVKYRDKNGNECFTRFIYFKFQDLVEETTGHNSKFDEIISENVEWLKLIKEGNMEELYRLRPSDKGLSREKLIHNIAMELKLITERYRVLTYKGNLGTTNQKYSNDEFIPTATDAKSLIETNVLIEEYSFNNLKDLEDDIKEPREINFELVLSYFTDFTHNMFVKIRKGKQKYA